MTKATRKDIDRAVAIAPTNPTLAAGIIAAHHRSAATDKDACELVALAASLALPVAFVNGCMIAR